MPKRLCLFENGWHSNSNLSGVCVTIEPFPLIGLGAGGHAKAMIEVVLADTRYVLLGLLAHEPEGQRVLGMKILGRDDKLTQLYSEGVRHAFVGLGSIGNTRLREEVYHHAQAKGFALINVIHASAAISSFAQWGQGLTALAHSYVGAGARVGDNVVLNTQAIVEHDCQIGDHCFIATGAKLAGSVILERGVHVGIGATLLQGVRVGDYAIIGAGAVVIRDVPAYTTVVGVPAKPLK